MSHPIYHLELTILKVDVAIKERKRTQWLYGFISLGFLYAIGPFTDIKWDNLVSAIAGAAILAVWSFGTYYSIRFVPWEVYESTGFKLDRCSKASYAFIKTSEMFRRCSRNDFNQILTVLESKGHLPDTEGYQLVKSSIMDNLDHWEAALKEPSTWFLA